MHGSVGLLAFCHLLTIWPISRLVCQSVDRFIGGSARGSTVYRGSTVFPRVYRSFILGDLNLIVVPVCCLVVESVD